MAVPPPPPPPGPPPPPMLNLNVGGGGSSSNSSGQERNALLQSIQKGTKLRPTKTVDKSKPIISGKVNDVSSNTSSASSHAIGSSSTIGRSHIKRDQPGQPKLGGLFEGMATMPRLKPVGRGGIKTSPVDDQPQTAQSTTTPTRTPVNNGSVGALDFQTELMNKLNRKGNAGNVVAPAPPAQKATPPIPAQPPINRNNVNRGPPPQPPKQNEASSSSPATSSNGKPVTMPLIVIPNSNNSNNGMPILPNKSTLFSASTQQSPTPQQSPQSQSPSFINHQHSQSSPTPPKPVINYGKPNLAPKPPLLGNGAATGTAASSSAPSRPTVARHQSMRSPRSPPIAMTSDGPLFPSKANNNFGTIRVRNNFASTDEINKPSLIGRPNEPPPKPPQFNRPPPPVPTKSHSNNDISIADGLSSGNTAISSAKSEVTLNTGLSIPKAPPARSNSQVEADAPPLPPHRIAPKPNARINECASNTHPVVHTKSQAPSVPAPAVPKRTTSMQNQNSNAGSNTAASTVARRVIDLEMKFANSFHKANDFPAPPPFTSTTKSYPSQSGKNVAKVENRKKRAPSPPALKTVPQHRSNILQLNDKMFANESSNC